MSESHDLSYVINLYLVVNLSGEMIYTIAHRLKTVGTSTEKVSKVVADLIKQCVSNDTQSIIQSFGRVDLTLVANLLYKISHCSIIMLDYKNFSKLFQMVVMALKKSIIMCKSYTTLHDITINHMRGIKDLLLDEHKKVIQDSYETIEKLFEQVSAQQFYLIKRRLFNLFTFKNYKIGIYLQDGTQNNDGNIVARPNEAATNMAVKVGAVFKGAEIQAVLKGFGPYSSVKFSV